jgi:hypothetical protein
MQQMLHRLEVGKEKVVEEEDGVVYHFDNVAV